jgi:hypothetical protein
MSRHPKTRHSSRLLSLDPFRIPTERIAIDVHHGKVQKDFGAACGSYCSDGFPREVETIGIQNAKPPPIVLIANGGQNIIDENRIAIPTMDCHIVAILCYAFELRHFDIVNIDQVILAERWL